MAGPWEKYQKSPVQPEGPWKKYGGESKGTLRKIAEKVVDSPALPIAGGVAGGLAGLALGPGAIATAAAGGAAGEGYRQLAARALGMDSPKTSGEAAKEMGKAALEQGAGEATGQVLSVAGRVVAPAAKKVSGDLFQLVTKMRPEAAKTLYENPKALLPSTMKKASAGWREAAKKAGIPVDESSPALIKALKDPNTAFDTYEKILAGEPVSAAEAQLAKQVVKIKLMPAAKTERNAPLVNMYEQMRKAFIKRIGEESPEMAKANADYAVGKAGQKFRSFFPRNANDTPAYFRSGTLPAVLFGSELMRGDPVGGVLKGAAVSAGTSPLAIGSLIAAIGAMPRGTGRLLGRSALGTLSELIGDKFERK